METSKTKKVNYRLKAIRASIGLTQWGLSHSTSISQTRLSLIEQGYIEPSIKEKTRIVKTLGVKINDIFPLQKEELNEKANKRKREVSKRGSIISIVQNDGLIVKAIQLHI